MKFITKISHVVAIVVFMLFIACAKDDPAPIASPESATLVYPLNNESCESGTEVDGNRATILFDWNKSANTTSYRVYYKNLDTDEELSESTSIDSREITLTRETQYSWYVVSSSSSSDATAKSEVWQFYLSGDGEVNHVPFPATLTSPEFEEVLTGTAVTLTWEGSDIDNDILNYDVFLDENMDPTTKVGNAITDSELLQNLSSGKTYYWKVVTRDEIGNTSNSIISKFSIN